MNKYGWDIANKVSSRFEIGFYKSSPSCKSKQVHRRRDNV